MENYTKYALKSWEELAALLEDKDNLFVISCNKCFKAFETLEEPEQETVLSLAAVVGLTILLWNVFASLATEAGREALRAEIARLRRMLENAEEV